MIMHDLRNSTLQYYTVILETQTADILFTAGRKETLVVRFVFATYNTA